MKRWFVLALMLFALPLQAQQLMPWYRLAWLPTGGCGGIGLWANENKTRDLYIYMKYLPSLECPSPQGMTSVDVVLNWPTNVMTIVGVQKSTDAPADWNVTWADCPGGGGVKYTFAGSTPWAFQAEWRKLGTFTLRGIGHNYEQGYVEFRRDGTCPTTVHFVGSNLADPPSCAASLVPNHDLCETPGGGTAVPFYTERMLAISTERPGGSGGCDDPPCELEKPDTMTPATWSRVKALYKG